ncbi:hypothetical protein ACCO45_013622 [Purpureocillium lilacinum]|uniref:Uncharacterized protein n=1 Tax=Purpureocillium lilacinum TaxID=33203 RepID=A0ACC4D9F4_PURLI
MSASALFLTRFSGRRAGTRESNPSSEESLVPPSSPSALLGPVPPLARSRAVCPRRLAQRQRGPRPLPIRIYTRHAPLRHIQRSGHWHARIPSPAVSCAAPIVPRQSQSRTYEVQDTTASLGARGGPRQSSRPAASHCSVVVVSSRRCPARWLLAAARLRCCAWLMPSVAVAAARANISAGTDLLRYRLHVQAHLPSAWQGPPRAPDSEGLFGEAAVVAARAPSPPPALHHSPCRRRSSEILGPAIAVNPSSSLSSPPDTPALPLQRSLLGIRAKQALPVLSSVGLLNPVGWTQQRAPPRLRRLQ